MSPVYDLSPLQSPGTTVNITEDNRSNLGPVVGSPFSVGTTGSLILPANSSRATAAIFNAGPATIFLREGTTPATTSVYNYPLPANRLWEPDSNFRYLGAMGAVTAGGAATVHVSESVVLI